METVYLSCAEVAKMFGKKEATVRKWCRTGKLKASQPTGNAWWIKKSDLDAFLNGTKGE